MKIDDNLFQIMEEVKVNPDYEFPTNFIPIRVDKEDFDFARNQINKYVSHKTKKYLKLHKKLKDEKEHFLREEGEKKSYWFGTTREWEMFIKRRIDGIVKGRDYRDIEKIGEDWDYVFLKVFWEKYVSPFVELSGANAYLNQCKKKVSEIDINEAKKFLVKEEK